MADTTKTNGKGKGKGSKGKPAPEVETEVVETTEVTADMFDVVITRLGGSSRWRVAVEANENHPTESGEVEVRTVRSLADAETVVTEAISNACDSDD